MTESILLVDHRRTMRDAWRLYLGRYPAEWVVVGESEEAALPMLLALITQLKPDIVLMNRQTGGKTLQRLLREIHETFPRLRVMLTGVTLDEVSGVRGWGTDAFLLSTDQPSVMLTRLRILRAERDY